MADYKGALNAFEYKLKRAGLSEPLTTLLADPTDTDRIAAGFVSWNTAGDKIISKSGTEISLGGGAGSQGPQGIQGIQGIQGLAGTSGVVARGNYSGATAYVVNDLVTYNGTTYICSASSTGNLPTDVNYFAVFAAQGVQGIQGIQGIQGVAGSTGAQGLTGATGTTGNTGATGATGAQGIQGLQGTQGIQGLTGVSGVVSKGTFNSGTTYAVNDLVTYNGTTYICSAPSTGNLPTNTSYFAVFAAQGVQGIQGIAGPTGATGPQGAQGLQGVQGNSGVSGVTARGAYNAGTAYAINDLVTYSGTTYLCFAASTGNLPTNTSFFSVFAAQGVQGPAGVTGSVGATGPTGPTGATGPQGTQGPAGTTGATGSNGATGATGAQGIQGIQGIQGVVGATGPSGVSGVNAKGNYSASTTYAVNDLVTYNGTTYIASGTTVGNLPTNTTYFAIFAAQGIQGTTGATGATGATGPTGAAGTNGAAGSTGPTGSTGPQGVQGIQGPQGVAGLTSKGVYSSGTAYAIGDLVTYSGSTYICILASTGNLPTNNTYFNVFAAQGTQGIQGTTGSTGPQGPSGTTTGSLLYTVAALGNLSVAPSAASSVDIAAVIQTIQTTTGISINIPNPSTTTAGRKVEWQNKSTATTTITVSGIRISPGKVVAFIWDGAAWCALADEQGTLARNVYTYTLGTTGLASSTASNVLLASVAAIVTIGGDLLVNFNAILGTVVSSGDYIIGVQVDSGTVYPISSFNSTNTGGTWLSGSYLFTGIAAGSHAVKIYGKSTGAVTGSIGGDANRPMTVNVIEIPSTM